MQTRPRGYLAAEDKLKAAGVEEVLVYCVNDGAVMDGWAKDQGVEGSIVTFLADTRAELTKALGMEMTHPGPMEALERPPGRHSLGTTQVERQRMVAITQVDGQQMVARLACQEMCTTGKESDRNLNPSRL